MFLSRLLQMFTGAARVARVVSGCDQSATSSDKPGQSELYIYSLTSSQFDGGKIKRDKRGNGEAALQVIFATRAERCRTSLDPDAPDQAADEEPLHVEDEGSEDAEDEGDPALHHPAPPSGKAPTRPAALRPVPSPPTQQTAPLQPSTAGAPGTEPEVNRSAEGQTGSWATGACGEEGRRARQAVDCSPTRGQAPPPLPFPSPGQADEGPFPGNLSRRSEVINEGHW
ncbi:hypothetical protein AGOR_G00253030 [Albula goreensis]|uniref:Uncharacterized protein n=1 Tax=Albula goreensis TaxID=1534307 RepID=A0A8T3CCU9_9TELE|nr:hypothetical protein AGOR_G00253030 [Albula goreensis]